jgi:hypothetical protein
MFSLINDQLTVEILDPVKDNSRLGSRYCTGGYIWQINDNQLGNLLSGPQYPDPVPTRFDGQGVPEVFETALGHNDCAVGGEVLVIGVGKVLRSSTVNPFHVRDNPEVKEFCSWEINQSKNSVVMITEQSFKEFHIALTREIILENRKVVSKTVLKNRGCSAIALRWFAHPFFPHTKDNVCCLFSVPVQVPENPGFYLNQDSYLTMSKDYPWNKGHYRPLEMDWGKVVKVKQLHPLIDHVDVSLEFPLAWMPVWANAATNSFEPYLSSAVEEGASKDWKIEYLF